MKLIDVSRASTKQLYMINAIRIKRGDIVITRSGSIGRVAYITEKFHNAIVSDDLIRVRIPDEKIRLYVLAFLQTKYAQDQMLRNEYGAIQQHLEPEHVRNLLVPLPEESGAIENISDTAENSIVAREALEKLNEKMITDLSSMLSEAITTGPSSSDL